MTVAYPSESTPGAARDTITYRYVNYRPLVLTVFFVLGLAGVALVWNLVTGGEGPGVVFVVLWLSALAWNAYSFLFLIADEIGVIDGSILRWRCISSSHEIPLTDLKGIRTPLPPFGIGLKRIVVSNGPSPLLIANRGYREVVAMIVQFRPDLVIRNEWYDRLYERFAKSSVRWRRVEEPARGR
ncbi:MAG TPA: hypothetical protein VK256_13785 [Candidatus Eisenbacteria bacterium]|nr:hypothetical protein [Candidatus Eisenbacteria bacterium]